MNEFLTVADRSNGAGSGTSLWIGIHAARRDRRSCLHNKRLVYDLLFKAASQTMLTIAADPKFPGARIGITAVLHT